MLPEIAPRQFEPDGTWLFLSLNCPPRNDAQAINSEPSEAQIVVGAACPAGGHGTDAACSSYMAGPA